MFPWIPTPPDTCNAPVVVDVEDVVDDTDIFPNAIKVAPTDTFPDIYVFPWIPTPPDTWSAPVVSQS